MELTDQENTCVSANDAVCPLLIVSLYCCSQPVLLLQRTAEFCSLGTYLWSYSKFWRVLQSLVELWEERLYPAELLRKFSSTIANSFSYNRGQEKCSAFTLCLVRNKKYLLEFLYCQLEHQTDVGHSGSIHLDPCEFSSKTAWSVQFCRMVTSMAFWPGQTNVFSSPELHKERFPWEEEGDIFVIRPDIQDESTARFPIDFSQSHQWCSMGQYFSICSYWPADMQECMEIIVCWRNIQTIFTGFSGAFDGIHVLVLLPLVFSM